MVLFGLIDYGVHFMVAAVGCMVTFVHMKGSKGWLGLPGLLAWLGMAWLGVCEGRDVSFNLLGLVGLGK